MRSSSVAMTRTATLLAGVLISAALAWLAAGSITIPASEQGQGPQARLASSSVEGSVYYITYRVD